MFNSNQFMKNIFILAILSVIGISVLIIWLISLVSQNEVYSSLEQTPSTQLEYITQSSAQTSLSIQSDQIASLTPFSPETTSIAPTTPSDPIWNPLSPLPNSNRVLITNGDRTEKKVALTFDVCQAEGDLSGYDTEIVRVLSETETPATFFLGGQWIRDHQTETLELDSNPLFELGNHSWSHLDFSVITPEVMTQEILFTQRQMFDLLGYQTNLFRLPYGTYSETALNVIGENGLHVIQWDVVSGDPDPNIDAASMTEWVLQQVNPGSIIIMHANGRGWHSAEALPTIIQTLRQNGYTLVTVSELLNIDSPK